MKKTVLLLALAFGISVLSVNAQEEPQMKTRNRSAEPQVQTRAKETPKPAEKPAEKTQKGKTAFVPTVSGTVISLSKFAVDGIGAVTKAEAETMVKDAEPLALKSGENIYLIYNAKNIFDGKSLAKFAEAKNLGVEGELKTVGGMNVIIAKKVQVVE